MLPIFIEKMTFKRTLGPNGTVITMISWKAGSRQRGSSRDLPVYFEAFVAKNDVQKKLYENPENQKWHQKRLFIKARH